MVTEATAATAGQASPADYFDTDSRGQCVNLIIHLLHNTREMPCICGPRGLGKTSFAHHLEALLRDDFKVLWVPLKSGEELAPAVCEQLGVPPSPLPTDWQRLLDELSEDKPLLVLVDDAERLSPNAQQTMLDMADAGIRFVFVGAGLPSPALKSHIREIDLPAFTLDETREFLSYLGRRAGVSVASLDAARLHKSSRGLPGLIIEQMEGRKAAKPAATRQGAGLRSLGLAALLVAVIAAALWFQDEINSLFSPDAGGDQQTVELPLPPQTIPAQPAAGSRPSPVTGPSLAETTEPAPPEAESRQGLAVPKVALPAVELNIRRPVATPSEGASAPAVSAPSAPDEAKPAAVARPPAPKSPSPPVAASTTEPVKPVEPVKPAKQAQPPEQLTPATAGVPAPSPATRQAGLGSVADHDQAWLRAQPADHFTLQLVGSRERSAIDRFIKQYKLPKPYGVFVWERDGKPWYSLVWGSFPDRQRALAASKQLPPAVRKDVWLRDFASIQGLIKG